MYSQIGCLHGTQFDLKTVSIISEKPIAQIGRLWIAIEKEIILPLNNNYKYIKTLKEMNQLT